MLPRLKKMLVYLLASSFIFVGFGQSAQAALIGTQELVAAADQGRAQLAAQLARPELQARLQALGIAPADAQARVAALSDQEAASMASQIDALPAGGDVLGAVVVIFAVLLITDILGFTKVYPFTRPIR